MDSQVFLGMVAHAQTVDTRPLFLLPRGLGTRLVASIPYSESAVYFFLSRVIPENGRGNCKRGGGRIRTSSEKTKYAFSELYEYLAHKTYPAHADKLYKHGLRKRSKFFMHKGGRLFYIGGEKRKENEKPRLVVESADERRRIIIRIHDQAHLGRDKTLSEITSRYYWPEMYNDICSYVSIMHVLSLHYEMV